MNYKVKKSRILLLRISKYLSPRRRIQLVLLLILMVASAASELISLGAVMPFLTVLTNPDNFLNIPWVNSIKLFSQLDKNEVVIMLTLLFAITAILAALIRLMTLRYGLYLSSSVGSDLRL